jgi:hypothetical protein
MHKSLRKVAVVGAAFLMVFSQAESAFAIDEIVVTGKRVQREDGSPGNNVTILVNSPAVGAGAGSERNDADSLPPEFNACNRENPPMLCNPPAPEPTTPEPDPADDSDGPAACIVATGAGFGAAYRSTQGGQRAKIVSGLLGGAAAAAGACF